MKKSLSLCALLVLFLSNILLADEVVTPQIKVGDTFKVYELEDAHHVKHSLKPDTRFVIISFEMDLSKLIHGWLEKKDADYLERNKAEYVADITEMPGLVTYLFARPKMQKYTFQILLADDENFAPQFPKEEGKFVLFEIDENRVVKNISYVKTPEELESLLQASQSSDASNAEIKEKQVSPRK